MLTGQCACGAVTYEVAGPFSYAMNCHCTRCRAATGSAFKPFGGVPRDQLSITAGEDSLHVVGEPEQNDTRCGACGSLLFSVVRGGAYVHVTLGTIAGDPGIRPQEHIFVGSMAPWYEIRDDLPQWDEYPT